MKVTHISAKTYSALAADFTADAQTIYLNGRWPVSIGYHDHYPGAQIMIVHAQDRFFMVELDPALELDLDPEFVKRATTINPDALQ